MITTSPGLDELRSIIRTAAREELLPRLHCVERSFKADQSIVTDADLATQQRIQCDLEARWPQYQFLGEEMSAEEQEHLFAQSSTGLWCLDPLDGTSNFAAGIPYFGVSLSLLINNDIMLGLVYDPVRDECFYAQRNGGAFLNGERLGAHRPEPPLAQGIGLVDLKRLPQPLAQRLAATPPYASQRSFGSVALDWCWLAAGRCHVYLHGRQNLWDYGAGLLIFSETGGHACTLDGEPVFQASLKPRSAVAALESSLFHEWTSWLGLPGDADLR
ncbi:MAG: inositol monophosphatase [Gammaproteobacteria bacterium]|nr:inositol monophosphatase [Gammaproteobacteria bacterium]